MKLSDQIGNLAGCNVVGRLRYIRSIVEGLPRQQCNRTNGNRWQAINEIDKLLEFVDPAQERKSSNEG